MIETHRRHRGHHFYADPLVPARLTIAGDGAGILTHEPQGSCGDGSIL